MSDDPIRADAARAMRTVTQHDEDRAARGRFGREVPEPAADDHLEIMGYEIDPDAVAAAIAERLIAGRTLVLEAAPARGG